MKTSKHIDFSWAKYFALATIAIEWVGLILILRFSHLSADLPLSQVSSYGNPAKPWVIVMIITASISYSIASLYFNNFYKNSFRVSLIAGALFSTAIILPYNQTPWSLIHIISALASLSLYVYMIYASSKSELLAGRVSKLFKLICILEVALTVGVFILYTPQPKMIIPLEITILAVIHIWPVVLATHGCREIK